MTTPALSAALVAAQRSAKSVTKEGYNLQQKIDYARSEDMIEEARAALGAADLALSRLSTKLAGDSTAELFRLEVVYLLEHGASGESREYGVSYWAKPHKGMPHDKAEAAAFTYALAYFLRDLLLIPRRLQGEVSPDERPETPTYEPRQRTEQRGWGQALVDRMRASLDVDQQIRNHPFTAGLAQAEAARHAEESAHFEGGMKGAPEPSSAVSTPFDAPDPDVVFAGFLESVRMARPDTIDAVWNSIDKCPEAELRADDYETLRVAVRQRKIDFCRTEADFAECVRAIQKARFAGESLVKLKAYHEARKGEVLGSAAPPAKARGRDPLPAPDPDEIPS